MRNKIGVGLAILGYLSSAIFGVWALALDLGVLSAVGGLPLAIIGFVVFPMTLTVAPLYAGFVQGDWQPLTVTVTGTLMCSLFMGIGMALTKKDKPAEA